METIIKSQFTVFIATSIILAVSALVLDGDPPKAAVPPTLSSVIEVTSPANAVCRNTINTCSDYGRQMCTRSVYKAWVSSHCAMYCGFCTPQTIPQSECEDRVPNCREYDGGELCSSERFFSWAYDNCKRYCKMGVCYETRTTQGYGITTTESLDVCHNTLSTCSHYGRQMCTRKVYEAWVNAHCALYCGKCTPKVLNPSECADKVPNCREFDDGTLCSSDSYYAWAYDNCRGYCRFGICNHTPTTNPKTG